MTKKKSDDTPPNEYSRIPFIFKSCCSHRSLDLLSSLSTLFIFFVSSFMSFSFLSHLNNENTMQKCCRPKHNPNSGLKDRCPGPSDNANESLEACINPERAPCRPHLEVKLTSIPGSQTNEHAQS